MNVSKGQKKETLNKWAEDLANFSSLHAVVWYTRYKKSMKLVISYQNCYRFYRFKSPVLKGLVLSFSTLIIFFLPAYLGFMLAKWSNEETLLTKTNWLKAEEVSYPRLTICNAKYFDKNKMEGDKVRQPKMQAYPT